MNVPVDNKNTFNERLCFKTINDRVYLLTQKKGIDYRSKQYLWCFITGLKSTSQKVLPKNLANTVTDILKGNQIFSFRLI